MGYEFNGFFSDGDEHVLKRALDRWPYCLGKRLKRPFRGIGIRCPDPEALADRDDDIDSWKERIHTLEKELPGFSAEFPESTFVFIKADCFGGTCQYAGFVVVNEKVSLTVGSNDLGIKNLRLLLKPLEVRLLTGHFPPFVRGHWDNPWSLG